MEPIKLYESIRAKVLKRPIAAMAQASGVSVRQINRIRQGQGLPNVAVLQALYVGLREVKPKRLDKRGEK